MLTLFEDLSNELLFDIFNYIDIRDLYKSFWRLNSRLNNLFQSLNNLSVTIENKDLSLINFFSHKIVRLVIDTKDDIDWNLFPNLNSLILKKTTWSQSKQLGLACMPNLTYLSLLTESIDNSSSYFAYQVFSNWFPSLRHANLGSIEMPYGRSWSQSPCLHFVSVVFSDPILLLLIPASCLNLHQFQVKLVSNNCTINLPSSSDKYVQNHPLKRLILLNYPGYLSFDNIDLLLSCLCNIEKINLVLYNMPFFNLIQTIIYRLTRLHRFDCYISEFLQNNQSIDIETIRQIHPCFNRIQCIIRKNGSRIYTTNNKSQVL